MTPRTKAAQRLLADGPVAATDELIGVIVEIENEAADEGYRTGRLAVWRELVEYARTNRKRAEQILHDD